MATSSKPKYIGTYAVTGKKVSFNRVWGSYTFTDDECEELLKGNTVDFFHKRKLFIAKLGDSSFKNASGVLINYFGIIASEKYLKTKFPASWCGHIFTKEDLLKLANNEAIMADDFRSKHSKPFTAIIYFNNTYQCIVPKGLSDNDLRLYLLNRVSSNNKIKKVEPNSDGNIQITYDNSIIVQVLESDWIDNEESIRESSIKEVFENYAYEITINIDDIKDYFNNLLNVTHSNTTNITNGYLLPTPNYKSINLKDEYYDF